MIREAAVAHPPCYISRGPCRVGLVVSVSASHTVGRGFVSRPGYT